MIFVRLMGGLGNQMFQYALGRKLSITNKKRLVIDLSHLDNQPEGEVPRNYELDCFNISAKIIHQPAETYRGAFLKRTNPKVINEQVLAFDQSILSQGDNVVLVGYWQTEKYFKDVEEQIRKDFSFIKPLSELKKAISDEISTKQNAVSLHVRRGDYVTHSASNKFHGLMPLAYFEKASEIVAKQVKSPHFFVISDDPEWCRKNIKLKYPVTFVDHIPNTGQEDMRLMSLCRHNIIANSSFSWWGAWLNNNPKKIVVAPKNWFAGADAKLDDRLPKNWTRI